MTKALDTQVGGDHYKKMKIQTMEFSMANGLNACQHTIIKYVCRYKDKGGIEDLKKAKHVLDLLIELEYPESSTDNVGKVVSFDNAGDSMNKVASVLREQKLKEFDQAAAKATRANRA